jgi:hypothetical protein
VSTVGYPLRENWPAPGAAPEHEESAPGAVPALDGSPICTLLRRESSLGTVHSLDSPIFAASACVLCSSSQLLVASDALVK